MDLVVKSYSQICQIRNQLILIDNLDPKLAVVYGIFFASILPSHENLDIDQWLLKSVALFFKRNDKKYAAFIYTELCISQAFTDVFALKWV